MEEMSLKTNSIYEIPLIELKKRKRHKKSKEELEKFKSSVMQELSECDTSTAVVTTKEKPVQTFPLKSTSPIAEISTLQVQSFGDRNTSSETKGKNIEPSERQLHRIVRYKPKALVSANVFNPQFNNQSQELEESKERKSLLERVLLLFVFRKNNSKPASDEVSNLYFNELEIKKNDYLAFRRKSKFKRDALALGSRISLRRPVCKLQDGFIDELSHWEDDLNDKISEQRLPQKVCLLEKENAFFSGYPENDTEKEG